MADRHPELPIVLEHIGFPRERDDEYFESWLRGIEVLAKAPNITCKISGVAMTDPRFTAASVARWIDACLDTFGPDNCIIGSNWPVDRLFSSYDPIMNIYRDHVSRFDEADQRKILSENARRLYRLR
jgi:predicted TIM-barrel fold metal-dependent hydrolase